MGKVLMTFVLHMRFNARTSDLSEGSLSYLSFSESNMMGRISDNFFAGSAFLFIIAASSDPKTNQKFT